MQTVVQIFDSREKALAAVHALRSAGGVDPTDIQLLMPGTMSPSEFKEKAHTHDEEGAPGAWSALGAGIGSFAGAALISVVVPGIGPILGLGAIAAAFAGGAVGGHAAGRAIEKSGMHDDSRDDFFLFEEMLRRDKNVLVVRIGDKTDALAVQNIATAAGGVSIDHAREDWWIERRAAEVRYYEATHRGDFGKAERAYRRGFELGSSREFNGRSYESVAVKLRPHRSDAEEWDFRHGFERAAQMTWERQAKISHQQQVPAQDAQPPMSAQSQPIAPAPGATVVMPQEPRTSRPSVPTTP